MARNVNDLKNKKGMCDVVMGIPERNVSYEAGMRLEGQAVYSVSGVPSFVEHDRAFRRSSPSEPGLLALRYRTFRYFHDSGEHYKTRLDMTAARRAYDQPLNNLRRTDLLLLVV